MKRILMINLIVFAVILSSAGNLPAIAKQPAESNAEWVDSTALLSRDLAPYDAGMISSLTGNYLQSLLDSRYNLLQFDSQMAGNPNGIRGISSGPALYFVDDQGRAIWALCEEERYSPIVRLELIKKLADGIMRAKIPGTDHKYFFSLEGRIALNIINMSDGSLGLGFLQDAMNRDVKIKFRAQKLDGTWIDLGTEAKFKDNISGLFEGEQPNFQRNSLSDHFEFTRQYDFANNNTLNVSSKSFRGNSDRAPYIEVSLEHPAGLKNLEIGIESSGGRAWGTILKHTFVLPNRMKLLQNEVGSLTFIKPDFNYIIDIADGIGLGGKNWDSIQNWGTYASSNLLVWKGRPEEIEFKRDYDKGVYTGDYFRYDVSNGKPFKEKMWFATPGELDPQDISYIHGMARSIARKEGVMGFGPYQHVRTSLGYASAVSGLSSAAYVLAKYSDADAGKVKKEALGALRVYVNAEKRGIGAYYLDHVIIAAYYLRKLGYTEFDPWVKVWADRLMARRPNGEDMPWMDANLQMIRGLQYAYEITGDPTYAQAFKTAASKLSVGDKPGVFVWKGAPYSMDEPNGTCRYFGYLGNTGSADEVAQFIKNAGVYFTDNGFAAAGDLMCDDVILYYLGHSLKFLNLYSDQEKKRIVGLSEFPIYNNKGIVKITNMPNLYNPNYPIKSTAERYKESAAEYILKSINYRAGQQVPAALNLYSTMPKAVSANTGAYLEYMVTFVEKNKSKRYAAAASKQAIDEAFKVIKNNLSSLTTKSEYRKEIYAANDWIYYAFINHLVQLYIVSCENGDKSVLDSYNTDALVPRLNTAFAKYNKLDVGSTLAIAKSFYIDAKMADKVGLNYRATVSSYVSNLFLDLLPKFVQDSK